MKTIFDKNTRAEIKVRMGALTPKSKAQWGRMTAAQMVKHCILCEEYYHGNVTVKRSLLGRLVGGMAIRSILKDDASGFPPNAQTPTQFRVTDNNLDLEAEKARWKQLIDRYETFGGRSFTHWFFGTMTKEQLGHFIYKHTDHHLRQFGV